MSWLFATFSVFINGILSSISILISQKYGANDKYSTHLVVRDGLKLCLILAILTFLVFWNMSFLFLLFGQSSTIVLISKTYLHSLVWGLLPNYLTIAFFAIIVGFGHTRVILIFNVISVVLIIFFSYILIFGKFSLPALGISGSGWGITIGYWITFILLSIYLLNNTRYKCYFQTLFNSTKKSFLSELLQVGIPLGVMYCVEEAAFFALTLRMGSLGSQVMAANQVVLQYMGLMLSIIFSIAQATTVRIGYLFGIGDIASLEQTGYSCIFISTTFMLIVAFFYWFFPLNLIALDFDIHNPKNMKTVLFAVQFLTICAIYQILDAMRISFFAVLRGLKDTRFTLLISFVSLWCIALPVGYLLTTFFNFSGDGLWWGMVLGACFNAISLFSRFKFKLDKSYHEVVQNF